MLVLGTVGTGVVLSALKKTDGRDSVTVRIFNPSTVTARVDLSLPGGLLEAAELNLLEEPQRTVTLSQGTATLDVNGAALRTVELVPAQAPPRRAPR
jgi:alpha-mannosidase